MLNEDERQEYEERIQLLTNENDLLFQQNEILKQRNQELEEFAQQKAEENEKNGNNFYIVQQELLKFKEIAEKLRQHKNICEDKLKQLHENEALTQKERDQLKLENQKLSSEFQIVRKQAEYFKRSYEEMERRKKEEIEILEKELNQFQARERELVDKGLMQERDLLEARERCSQLKRELDALRTDCDNMVRIMEKYERDITTFQNREEQTQNLIKEAKKQMEESKTEKEKLALKEQKFLSQIEKLQQQVRENQNQSRERNDSFLENIRQKHRLQLQQREQENYEIQQKMTELEIKHDKMARETNTLKSDLQRSQNLLKEERQMIQQKLDDYEKKIKELEEVRISEKRIQEDQTFKIDSYKSELEQRLKAANQSTSDLQTSVEKQKLVIVKLEEENRMLSFKAEQNVREKESLAIQIQQVQQSNMLKSQGNIESYNFKIQSLHAELQDAQDKIRAAEDKTFEILKAQDKIAEK